MEPNKNGQRYSEEKKNEIMKFLENHTYKQTVDKYNVSEPTLARWKSEVGKTYPNIKSKIILTIPQYWLDYLNEKIKEGTWDNYDHAIVQLLKNFDADLKKIYPPVLTEPNYLQVLIGKYEEYMAKNPEVEAIVIKNKDGIVYQSEKWPSDDISRLTRTWSQLRNRYKISTSLVFNGEKYCLTRSNDEQIVFSKSRFKPDPENKGELIIDDPIGEPKKFIIGVRTEIQDQHWIVFAIVRHDSPCHIQTAQVDLERIIMNSMPVSEEDIMKFYTKRDLACGRKRISPETEEEKLEKQQVLGKIQEEQEQIPLHDIDRLAIEKLESKFGFKIPKIGTKQQTLQKVYYHSVQGHITKLKICGMSLTEIPNVIKELAYLDSLDLSDNQIEILPSGIGNLINLEELTLWSNKLSSLPSEFANLQSLKTLDVGRNQFTELPTSILKLRKIEEIRMTQNKLTVFPAEIRNISGFRHIDLSENLIEHLDLYM